MHRHTTLHNRHWGMLGVNPEKRKQPDQRLQFVFSPPQTSHLFEMQVITVSEGLVRGTGLDLENRR